MSFATVINCMDGRTQDPVNTYLKEKYNVQFVDVITEAGPNGILATRENELLVTSILNRVNISVKKHGSTNIAIIGHYDCAGNPVSDKKHNEQTLESVKYLKEKYPSLEVIGLWIGNDWKITEIKQ